MFPEPPSDAGWGCAHAHVCTQAAGREVEPPARAHVRVLVCLSRLWHRSEACPTRVPSCVYSNAICTSVNVGSRCGLMGAFVSLGPGVRRGCLSAVGTGVPWQALICTGGYWLVQACVNIGRQTGAYLVTSLPGL